VRLTKDYHKINLRVGDTLVLIDDNPSHLKNPVELYQGTVAVPLRFKEQILDPLLRESRSVPKANLALSKIRKIVIDAGHGGTDPGAIGRTGLREKNVTLDLVKRLNTILKSDGFQTVLTRSSDRFIPLPSRVDIANNSGADIFVSIHANANRVRSLKGFEVYYVSPSVDDSKRALLAAQEQVLNLDRKCFASNSLNLKTILWDMIYTENRAESIELSHSICNKVKLNLDTEILGIKGARFLVLKGTYMPAVLVEIGFLSNAQEEQLLKNGYYRQQMAEAIAQAIESYAQGLIFLTKGD
jgi:N-acetylmuramoyl-L-alanine amidase